MSTLTTTLSQEDVATIRGLFASSLEFARAGDWALWASQYAEDAILHPPHEPGILGRAAIQAWGESLSAIEDLSLSNVQIAGEGDLVYCTCGYSLTLKDQPTDIGKELLVLRRTGTGWECVAASFNSDTALMS